MLELLNNMVASSKPESLQVRVISPSQLLFSGPALSVSSKNSSGDFDLLPEHANMITFIDNHPITIRKPDASKVTFEFPLAIVYIIQNNVTIYAQPETVKI